jgi:hypothetical protein
MSGVRFVLTDPGSLAPYVPELRRLEQSIRYPISDGADHFFIDHGPDYHPFFSGLGEAHFLLALRGERVIGSIAGVARSVTVGQREFRALYLCDLKVAAEERGRGLSRRLIQVGLGHVFRHRDLRRTRFFYGAAMRGDQGDVMRTAQGAHPFKMGSLSARLKLYFASPEVLARLDLTGAPPPPPLSGRGARSRHARGRAGPLVDGGPQGSPARLLGAALAAHPSAAWTRCVAALVGGLPPAVWGGHREPRSPGERLLRDR